MIFSHHKQFHLVPM